MQKVKKFILDLWAVIVIIAMCVVENFELFKEIGIDAKTAALIRFLGMVIIAYAHKKSYTTKKTGQP